MEIWQEEFISLINKIAQEPSDTKKFYIQFGVKNKNVAEETILFIKNNGITSIDYSVDIDNYPQHEKLLLKFDELLDKYLPEEDL